MPIPDNHLIVIFGASGDLTSRKLIPALFNLYRQNQMPERFAILGTGRTQMDDDSFRREMFSAIPNHSVISGGKDRRALDDFMSRLFYISLNSYESKEYERLRVRISSLKKELSITDNIIFYLATPPVLYDKIPHYLAENSMNKPSSKLIIEKPFGQDLNSAIRLNRELLEFFQEDQLYRIDHYLGKETVQNILVTRFSNHIFEPLWNRNYVHHVEITSSETVGVERRGGYYEAAGALRDMVQNHLLQIVGLVGMEPPVLADSRSIRDEMLKVFQSLRPLFRERILQDVIRGQYTSSTIRGDEYKAYREEEGVSPGSRTETYVALKFYIDNWRWQGVPFYIRTGKRLPTRVTEIVIHFEPTPHHIFCSQEGNPGSSNQLVIRIQPDEGILLKFGMKVPGAGFTVQDVNMDFHYSSLSHDYLPEAYERLLLDCMLNDPTLYARADNVEATWKFIQPVLDAWNEEAQIPLYGYPSGTWGPEVADDLIEEPWIKWRYPCKNLTNDGKYCEL